MSPGALRTEEVGACPICEDERLHRWSSARDRLHGLVDQEFVYSQCRRCRLVLLSSRPVEDDAALLYPVHYAAYVDQSPSPDAAPPSLGRVLRALSRAQAHRPFTLVDRALGRLCPDRLPGELRRLYEPPTAAATIVDYGCGRTDVLDRARDRGWAETIGVDFAPSVLERVAAAGHRAVRAADLASEIEDGSVDLVRLNHVLEHLYDPLALLRALRAKLRPAGSLHIAVPNGSSLWAALFRRRWFNADPRHLFLYRPSHVRLLAGQAGFDRVQIFHETITRDIARSWGYVLEDRGRISHGQAHALSQDSDRARLLWYPARLSAMLGVGDRFHAVVGP